MKNYLFLVLIGILFYSCSSRKTMRTDVRKVTFGIFETVLKDHLPDYVNDSLLSLGVRLEEKPGLINFGYTGIRDSVVPVFDHEDFRFCKTIYPVDKGKKYAALIALKSSPVMNISDIEKCFVRKNLVEISFNYEGSRKWAEMTRTNTGKNIAFVIDDRVYSLPVVNDEIRSGIAIINGIGSKEKAEEIAAALNASIE